MTGGGRFRQVSPKGWSLVAGGTLFLVRAEGFVPHRFTPDAEERRILASTGTLPGIEISLRPEVAIEGRVYGPDRQPVKGATITLAKDCSGAKIPAGSFVRSGEGGAFHLRGVDSEGEHYLIARALRDDGTELRSEPFPLSRVVSPVPGRAFWWDLHLLPVTPETPLVCRVLNQAPRPTTNPVILPFSGLQPGFPDTR